MLSLLQHIFLRVLLPVLVLVGLGALIQRIKTLDLPTLVRLNLYLFVPAFLFVKVAESELSWLSMVAIGTAILLAMAVLAAPIWLVMRRRAAPPVTASMIMGGLFFNAGNFGVPIVHLAFGPRGDQVQALVVMFANTAIFFFGYVLLALAQGRPVSAAARGYLRLPMVYALGAGLTVRATGIHPWPWLQAALRLLADALVPIALVTLGAQLASRPRWPRWRVVAPIMLVKLLALPAVMAVVVVMMKMWPWPGAVLIVAAAGPSAVNNLLLAVEVNGDTESAAEAVFWTTVASAVSVTVILMVVMSLGGYPVPVPR